MKAEFYLGTPEVHWLWDPDPRFDGVTLFVSRARLARRKTPFPKALHSYCIDSGGFTELADHGRWRITAAEYVAEIRRYLDQLGRDKCRWVAPQDEMCEEVVIRGGVFKDRTFVSTRELRGLNPGDPEQDLTTAVRIHQRHTVDNYLELTRLAPEVPFIPVLQGNALADYLHCIDLYEQAGVDLNAAPVVGLGSVCRRENTTEIAEIVDAIRGRGIRKLHGFGVKSDGLGLYGDQLASADSQAWSFGARRRNLRSAGCRHQKCTNCKELALPWHAKVQATPPLPYRQLGFDLDAA